MKNTFSMKRATVVLAVLILILAAVLYIGGAFANPASGTNTDPALVAYFEERMTTLGVADIGQPIEGFDAQLLIMAFPGLTPGDFEGVAALEGVYRVQNGEVEFVRGEAQPVTSAERMVTSEGYATLLANVSSRLGAGAHTAASIDALIERLNTGERIEARIDEGGSAFGIKVVPLEVLEDSRCPADVQCIQAGTVRVRVQLTETDNTTTEEEVALGKGIATTAGVLTLRQVLPEPFAGEDIQPGDYLFIFSVEKTQL